MNNKLSHRHKQKKCHNLNHKNMFSMHNKNLKAKFINKNLYLTIDQPLKEKNDQNILIHLLLQLLIKIKIDLCKQLILIIKEIVYLKNNSIRNKTIEINYTDKDLKVV